MFFIDNNIITFHFIINVVYAKKQISENKFYKKINYNIIQHISYTTETIYFTTII